MRNDSRYRNYDFNYGGKPDFLRMTKLVDEHGTAVILKNNVPRHLVIDFSKAEKEKAAPTEDVLVISERLFRQNMEAYEVLAK